MKSLVISENTAAPSAGTELGILAIPIDLLCNIAATSTAPRGDVQKNEMALWKLLKTKQTAPS